MTAPLFHLPYARLADAQPGTRVVLDGAEGRHAATVRRIGVGEQVLLADGTGAVATTTVAEAGRDELVLLVESVDRSPSPATTFVLVQALAKDGRDLQAVEAATELGVDRVLPWQAERSIVRWRGDRAAKAHAKWVSATVAAAKQSRRATVPEVGDVVGLDGLVAVAGDAAATLVLHEEAEQPIGAVELPAAGEVLVVVGPEGGISPAELAALRAAGATDVRLGSTVLRSSTAGPAALAVLLARSRWSGTKDEAAVGEAP